MQFTETMGAVAAHSAMAGLMMADPSHRSNAGKRSGGCGSVKISFYHHIRPSNNNSISHFAFRIEFSPFSLNQRPENSIIADVKQGGVQNFFGIKKVLCIALYL